jgi:site-specific DNA recombinase
LDKISKFTSNDRLIKEVVEKVNNRYKGNINPIQNEYNQIKKLITKVQASKDKILGLYEKDRISEEDLNDRLIKLNDEKQVLEERLSPLAIQLNERSKKEISFEMVKEVMTNFEKSYKETITTEQRKHLLQLLINKITISDRKKIDTIQIQYNNQVVHRFAAEGEEKSSNDDFSSPFCIYIDIP